MTITENKTLPGSFLPTLPGSAYSDPQLFAREQELIFEQLWFCAVRSNNSSSRSGRKRFSNTARAMTQIGLRSMND